MYRYSQLYSYTGLGYYTGIRAHNGPREFQSRLQNQLTVCFVLSLVFRIYRISYIPDTQNRSPNQPVRYKSN